MRTLAPVLTATALLTVACVPATTEISEAERSIIVEEITAVLDSFWGIWRAVDYDQGMSFYLDSPETAFTSHGATMLGFSELNDAFRPAFIDIERQEIALDRTHINVLSREAVHVTESGSYTQFDDNGAEIRSAPFSFSTTWVLSEGEWKIVTCHQSEQQQQTE